MTATPAEQYVRYAAATHSTLLELLVHWQPWASDLEWPDLAVHVPVLAAAVAGLVDRGEIELLYGPAEGEIALVSPSDVPGVVNDPANWWSGDSTPQTELFLGPDAGPVPVPMGKVDS